MSGVYALRSTLGVSRRARQPGGGGIGLDARKIGVAGVLDGRVKLHPKVALPHFRVGVGGVTQSVREVIAVASVLVPRDAVQSRVEMLEWVA